MSYCRFSSDDFQCDLYCYADVNGGYTTWVASNRVVFTEPVPPKIMLGSHPSKNEVKRWLQREQIVSNLTETAMKVPITLPFAGDQFNDATLEEFKVTLLKLREVGYNFPDYVLERVDAEIKDQMCST